MITDIDIIDILYKHQIHLTFTVRCDYKLISGEGNIDKSDLFSTKPLTSEIICA